MRIYTPIGKESYAQDAIDQAITRLQWQNYTKGQAVPMGQAMVVQRICTEYKVQQIKALALYGTIRPYQFIQRERECTAYNLIGIDALLGDNTHRRLYVSDEGVTVTIVAVDDME